ncbi:MAG: hypothetical protein IKG21_12975 [Atopobiaceae bacterium]|nr:hypothetical protein [Atopobiaceae bacterium]MBR3318723.1 hypothetical protein [Atopobiaceae bacterium]
MSTMEKIRDGLTERGIAFRWPQSGPNEYTWLRCSGRETSFIQRSNGTIDLICYGIDAEQALAFVDAMESK